jgi:outer membrane protein TolC
MVRGIMRNIFCLLVAIWTLPAWAELHDLVDDFYRQSIQLKLSEVNAEKAEQGLKAFESQLDWRLTANLNRSDSFPAALFSFQSQRTIDNSLDYSLSKATSWGGQLNFTQEIVQRDLSNWDSSNNVFNLPSTEPYQITNTISYTQDLARDFFGLRYGLDLEQQQKNLELSRIGKTFEEENQLFNLFSMYITAKYQKALVTLNQEAVKRAKTRLRTVKKRVRDGLSLKVDRYQAEKAMLASEEQLNSVEANLIDSLEQMNQSINQEVNAELILPYSLEHEIKPQLKTVTDYDNLEIKMALKNLEIAKLAYRSLDRALYPDINFQYSLSNNAIQGEFGDAFSDSQFGQTNKTEVFGLSLSIPLGFSKEEADLATQRAEVQYQKHRSDMLAKRIMASINLMNRKYMVLKKNLESGRQRVRLAGLALKEQNRLYSLGKVDIDTVIRTEEDLINTQMTFISYVMNVEMTMASIAKLSGYFSDLFVEYRD